ncbi:enoyl-CoA hydratase/isomerase family protein [Mycobacterium sp. PSTR-4-N]|uniref:enoyl-CoA hydratase/isomerase family protein n=1 Tax=Mycobacterium sp. PSTR-4-N TaxID=2917745 RepID=UPI001F1568BF|nr:enoyl-CoA hydratase/isomerase family protein [Mycobacterium sp. PSTR-4-N]MCG7593972.1 enoyl-CoA hydratase/isomerase family protein [Mycobacterium sp. PSTR-4-N]
MSVTITSDDSIAILDLGDGENRFSPEFLDDIDQALDRALADGAQALVTTAGAKFYSNGLDLEWLGAHSDQGTWYVGRVHRLLARVLTLEVPTAAAVVGHAFGAGAMLALAHDFRVMRTDRGFFCLPEVDIRIPFHPGMAALIQAKLTPAAAVASMTTGRRFGGADAHAYGIVDSTAAEGEVSGTAADLLRPLAGKDRGTLGAIKNTMFGSVVDALRQV